MLVSDWTTLSMLRFEAVALDAGAPGGDTATTSKATSGRRPSASLTAPKSCSS